MRNTKRYSGLIGAWAVAATLLPPACALAADETGITLAEGPGRDQVRAACSMCHSLDYIQMNSPFQDKGAWAKTVDKMITVFGAPLSAEEAAVVVAYLDRHYGRQANASHGP